jgi:ABC-type Fe3+ transport system substrate-binding protein
LCGFWLTVEELCEVAQSERVQTQLATKGHLPVNPTQVTGSDKPAGKTQSSTTNLPFSSTERSGQLFGQVQERKQVSSRGA